jgi:LPXTG-site transpeptidase (sortase) family protein
VRRGALGSALLVVGAILLVLCVGTIAYAQWTEWQYQLEQAALPQEALPERLEVAPARIASLAEATDSTSASAAALVADETAPADPLAGESSVPEPLALDPSSSLLEPAAEDSSASDLDADAELSLDAPVSYGRAVRVHIPRIGVNSTVTEVGVQGGEYQVPGWNVGHHVDSPNPGEPGNSVFNGHLETINAGRVFARLKELKVGDAVYIYTDSHRLDWVIEEVRTVPNTDDGFIDPTPDTRITLYTCAGTFLPLIQDYSHRLAVVGRLVETVPKG